MLMDDASLLGSILGAGTGGALILALVQKFFSRKKDAAETTALIADATGKTSVIEVLERRIGLGEDRMAKQDSRIAELETRVTTEITLRLAAQEENHILRMRVTELEHIIAMMRGTGTMTTTTSTMTDKTVIESGVSNAS